MEKKIYSVQTELQPIITDVFGIGRKCYLQIQDSSN